MNDLQFTALIILALVSLGLGIRTDKKVQACGEAKCLETLKKHAAKTNGEASLSSKT